MYLLRILANFLWVMLRILVFDDNLIRNITSLMSKMTQTFEKKSSRQYHYVTNMFSKIYITCYGFKKFWPGIFEIYVVVVSNEYILCHQLEKKWWSKCVLNYIVLTSQSIWHFDESNRIIQNVDPNFQKEFIMLQLLFSYISEVIVVISPLLNKLGEQDVCS